MGRKESRTTGGAREAGRPGRRGGLVPAAAGIRAGRSAGAGATEPEPARDTELHAAVGQIDDYGGDGGPAGVQPGGEPDAGGESERAAERGVPAQGGRVRAAVGSAGEGRRRQRNVAGVGQPVTDYRAAGERGDDPGILGGGAAVGGRSVAGERRGIFTRYWSGIEASGATCIPNRGKRLSKGRLGS